MAVRQNRAVHTIAAFCVTLAAVAGRASVEATQPRLQIVIMDPLSKALACDCVAGYAQRDYQQLADFLRDDLERVVHLCHVESLRSPQLPVPETVDLIIGKFSEVSADAAQAGLPVRCLAMLSGQDGSVTQHGLFVVRNEDPARSIEDLAGRRLLFGRTDSDEKRSAALASLEAFDVKITGELQQRSSCSTAALAVAENDADAAIISSYAMPLLEGCGTIDKGRLRIVGETDRVPFIGVFATDRVDVVQEAKILESLRQAKKQPLLLTALESRAGFIPLSDARSKTAVWGDWRGPDRKAHSRDVLRQLSKPPQLLWSRTLTGPGMAGVAVANGYLVVTDKGLDETEDIFRCLDANTGRQIWELRYPAAGHMDFTNSPRATPLIVDDMVYLLGAFGPLHAVQLDTGNIIWRRHLAEDFGAERPPWGYSATPLRIDDKLIVNPGAPDSSLVALDRRTGETRWRTPGERAAYASFVLAEPRGTLQIIGYDAVSLGGWDPQTGRRLWRLIPELAGDFNVPTPIVLDDRLLVTTENNGTRLYAFDERGYLLPTPIAVNEDLAPDTGTPVVLDDLVYGNHGALVCLDLKEGLATRWEFKDENLTQYITAIAGNDHLLVMTQPGELYLLKSNSERFQCVAHYPLFADVPAADRDTWSHPALIGNRLYIRNLLAAYCFLLE